ncbi:hypothetical protein HYT52_00300 [Candidatus Woesearchaeota archaeon]|nr:hypothetical protein [Candidatus Woesearchaeota archaeon]
MDLEFLLAETRKYIEKYLEAFTKKGIDRDRGYTLYGTEISQGEFLQRTDAEEVNLHLTRFSRIHTNVEQASIKGFIRAVSRIPSVVVLDIASYFGEEFGAWVASANRTAEVHVYEPEPFNSFGNYIFGGSKTGRVFQFTERPSFDHTQPAASINHLYYENGLRNITFHPELLLADNLDEKIRQSKGRKVVIFSHRLPTLPVDVGEIITQAVNTYDNVEAVLMPYYNYVPEDADPVTQMIRDNLSSLRLCTKSCFKIGNLYGC